MLTDEGLIRFFQNSGKRVQDLTNTAANLKHIEFYEAIEELKKVVEGSEVYFYGTRAMQLGHRKSHLNIFYDFENAYNSPQSPDIVEKLIEKLEEFFRAELAKSKLLNGPNSKFWKEPMKRLKTPVSTLRITLCNLQCDITFDCGLGVENTKLVNRMFSLQPEAYKLYHFVRIWIHIDEFAFKRYMVALLVIFYMQQKHLMPSVVELQKDVKENWITGWNVAFDRKKTLSDFGIKRMTNYRDHLISFFDFYRTFEFGSNVICPFLGRAVPIKSYSSDLEDFAKFMDNVKGFNKQVVNVADLFNLNYNVAYGVGKRRISKFVPFCAHAMNLLQNELKVENGLSLQLDSLNI